MKQSEAEDQRKTDEKDTDEVNDTSHNKSDVKEDETPEQVKDAAETGKFMTIGISFSNDEDISNFTWLFYMDFYVCARIFLYQSQIFNKYIIHFY